MADRTKTDTAELEKWMSEIDRMFLALGEVLTATDATLKALAKWAETATKRTDMEIEVLLRAIVRHRGLTPQQWTKKHLIRVLLAEEYGVKLPPLEQGIARSKARRR